MSTSTTGDSSTPTCARWAWLRPWCGISRTTRPSSSRSSSRRSEPAASVTTGPDRGLEQAMGRGHKVPAPFAFLWAAQFLSQFGDSIFQVAFIWLVLDLTGSKTLTGAAAAVAYLPSLLFGIVAGFLIDRWNRRAVMAWTDLARAVLLIVGSVLLFA